MEVYSRPYDELPLKSDKYAQNCTELHLGGKNVTALQGFEKFLNLSSLFLNDNRLTNIDGLQDNFRIKQLYLHNNRIRNLQPNCFEPFVFLNTLTLNGNLLDDLEGTIAEIKSLGHLKSVDLFDNPIAQEDNYRKRVICELSPSCRVLDRHEITPEERLEAKRFKVKMLKLQKLSGSRNRTLKLPPSEDEEAEARQKEAKMQGILQRIARHVKDTRPALEAGWAVYDKRQLGIVTSEQFWEIVRMFGIERMLDDVERAMVEERYSANVLVPAISMTGTLQLNRVNYFKFCWDVLPRLLQVHRPGWEMDVAPLISQTASDLNAYVKTVHRREEEYAATLRREQLERSRQLIASADSAGFGGRSRIEYQCEKQGLDPWLSAELSRVIAEFESSTAPSESMLSYSNVQAIFRKMMRFQLIPDSGVQKTLDRIFSTCGTGSLDSDSDTRQVSSGILRAILGCSTFSPKLFAPVPTSSGAAPPAAKGGKPGKAAAAASSAPGSSPTKSRPEIIAPFNIKWRPLTEDEAAKLGKKVCNGAAELLDKLLRKGAKDDSTAILQETLQSSVDVARITANQTFRNKKKTRSGYETPQEVLRQAKNRADVFVLPNLSSTAIAPVTKPGTASRKFTGQTVHDLSRSGVLPKGWAETTKTLQIS